MTKPKTMTTASRLTWVVSFANDDLGGLREGDWLNLRDDVGRFLGQGAGLALNPSSAAFIPRLDGAKPEGMSEPELCELQAATRSLLQAVTASTPSEGLVPQAIPTSVSWTLMPMPSESSGVLVMASGPIRDVFLTQLVFLLMEGGPGNLRRCPAPECERLFWKVGRRKYCSSRCTNRAVFRAWSKTEKGKTRSKREVRAAKQRRAYRRKQAEVRSRKGGGGR